jgi:predicted metal-dependent phosphoesterase TrpH
MPDIRIDLHTHSETSPDGALTPKQYAAMLKKGGLHYIAVTDHNTIVMAQRLQAEIGEQIIIGEEITAREGEIIGLFLTEAVPAALSVAETVACIREQGGLVYVPHPFETVRHGISLAVLDAIAADVDIIEVHNGRAVFQNTSRQAAAWALAHGVAGAASSDAHGVYGWGRTYSIIAEPPTRDNVVRQLAQAAYRVGRPGVRGVMYPKYNRLRKRIRR